MNAMPACKPEQDHPAADATHFTFSHKVFSVPGTVFRLDRATGRVAMHMLLGGVAASLDVSQLFHAFEIPEGGGDDHMLKLVEQALRHVREIRPGDSIPNEILDGTASWTLDPKHLELARSRLLLQLAAWVSEGNSAIDSTADVLSLIDRPEIKEKLHTAFGKAAEYLGLGKDGKQQLTDMIEQLAAELAYIEALRDKIKNYQAIRAKLRRLIQVYRNDRPTTESIERVIKLATPPLDKVRDQFVMIDGQTSEIISSLKRLSATIDFVRETRDTLREFVLLWDDLDTEWGDLALEASAVTEQLIGRTYRFAATHYLTSQRWVMKSA
jgi:hypothetical protein